MWYIVLSRSLREKEKSQQTHYDEHRRWLEDQHRAGRLLFSGPTKDGRYGIYILLAASLEEAKAIAAQDSHHLRGIRTMEVSRGTLVVHFAWTNIRLPTWSKWQRENSWSPGTQDACERAAPRSAM